MHDSPTLNARPAVAINDVKLPTAAPVEPTSLFWRLVLFVLGWTWRLVVAVWLCYVSFLTSLLVVGWLYRWMQGQVLRGWWKAGGRRQYETFADFRKRLGPNAPVNRPRWLLREDIRASLRRPGPNGQPAGQLRLALRVLTLPVWSLTMNLRIGIEAVVCTYLIAGWGCLLMTFSWWFGWHNSFHKGYELTGVGPVTGILGILLFVAAMLYVPMAQVHQAVTGDARAFFDFRFVWRLIRARLMAYVGLAGVFLFLGLIQEILKTAPLGFAYCDVPDTAGPALLREVLHHLEGYYFGCTLFLVFSLLVTRWLAAHIYRAAVLKVLRRGWVAADELHPTLARWFQELGPLPEVQAGPGGLFGAARVMGRWSFRSLLFPTLFLLWTLFVVKVYIGEFFHFHPVRGFMNHPLVQIPCVNDIPEELRKDSQEECQNTPAATATPGPSTVPP